MKATFQSAGTRTRLVGEWQMTNVSDGLYDVVFTAAGSHTRIEAQLWRVDGIDRLWIYGSMTQFVGHLQ